MSELRLLREMIRFIYAIDSLPHNEEYNLKSQIRRAAVSVALNVCEGNVFEDGNKKKFFVQALGSLQEVDECVILICYLGYRSNSFHDLFREEHYWKCLNSLKKLIESTHST